MFAHVRTYFQIYSVMVKNNTSYQLERHSVSEIFSQEYL